VDRCSSESIFLVGRGLSPVGSERAQGQAHDQDFVRRLTIGIAVGVCVGAIAGLIVGLIVYGIAGTGLLESEIIAGLIGAVAGAVLGLFYGGALALPKDRPGQRDDPPARGAAPPEG
jgi:hypothetical protein